MKYFAKYLPVEGEIKEDDLVRKHTNTIFKIDSNNAYSNSGNITLNHVKQFPKNFQKVKLFLCSRDIQLGDELTWIGAGTNPAETPFGNKIKHDTPLTTGKIHENWVKVIGEISPDAIWVKENDEFDFPDECTLPLVDEGRAKKYCFIKCPTCGTFH